VLNVEVVHEVEDQIDEPDQPDEALPHLPPPPPQQYPTPLHHTLHLAKGYWPEDVQLVHLMRGGKWSLLAQNHSIQAIVQDSIPLVFRHIVSVNSFPSGADKASSFETPSIKLLRPRVSTTSLTASPRTGTLGGGSHPLYVLPFMSPVPFSLLYSAHLSSIYV